MLLTSSKPAGCRGTFGCGGGGRSRFGDADVSLLLMFFFNRPGDMERIDVFPSEKDDVPLLVVSSSSASRFLYERLSGVSLLPLGRIRRKGEGDRVLKRLFLLGDPYEDIVFVGLLLLLELPLAAAFESSSPKSLLTAVECFSLFCANLLFIDCNGDGARIGDAVRVVVDVFVGFNTLAGDGDRDRVLLDFILFGDGEDARETRC